MIQQHPQTIFDTIEKTLFISYFHIFRQNKIGDLEKDPDRRKKKPEIKLPRKSARTVFKELEKLPKLTEFEKKQLQIYKPSFTKQVLDYSKFDLPGLGRSSLQKGRILYGNETDVNEYPWQVSNIFFANYCHDHISDIHVD